MGSILTAYLDPFLGFGCSYYSGYYSDSTGFTGFLTWVLGTYFDPFLGFGCSYYYYEDGSFLIGLTGFFVTTGFLGYYY